MYLIQLKYLYLFFATSIRIINILVKYCTINPLIEQFPTEIYINISGTVIWNIDSYRRCLSTYTHLYIVNSKVYQILFSIL